MPKKVEKEIKIKQPCLEGGGDNEKDINAF
jgi:hypothetical protein